MSPKAPTAGIIIIGDEVLKGQVQDTNSHYLCHQLWLLGVTVCKVVVVADDREEIADEVHKFAAAYDYVLTTGGVGFTHDDVTMEAVGKAFGEECIVHPDILKFLFGEEEDDPTSPRRKMAHVPISTKVHVRWNSNCILMCVHNVHCYPGVPSLLQELFQACKDLYRESAEFCLRELFVHCFEDIVAKPLSLVQSEYPAVKLGSYPNTNTLVNYRVKLTLESKDIYLLDKAYIRLVLLLPKDALVSSCDHSSKVESNDSRKEVGWLLDRLPSGTASLLPPSLTSKIHQTVATMEETYRKYRFEEVCVAFNGGKDCTAMLDLLHSYLTMKGHDFTQQKLKVLYVTHSSQFPEVEEFVEQAISRYSLDPIQISGLGIKESLCQLKHSHPQFKAIMMGTRHTDPYSAELTAFTPTDSSWPDYMRINCFLDWSYMEVWMFLRMMAVPYCSLYDRGYSSLDGMDDTHPNSHLAVSIATVVGGKPGVTRSYLPAYMLANEEHERAGRTVR